jgi:hypothetical protein
VLLERARDELAQTHVGPETLGPHTREKLLGNTRVQVDERIIGRPSIRGAPWHNRTS